MEKWKEPGMEELSPEEYAREKELYEQTFQCQCEKLDEACMEFRQVMVEFANKVAASLKKAAAPLVYIASEYAEAHKKRMQQWEINQGRDIGMKRQAHLAANARKYRTRKKNLNRIRKALEKGETHE